MDGITLWGMIREYVQAEATYQIRRNQDGPGATTTAKAAEAVTRAETAAREAMDRLVLTTFGR